jgi:D-alanine-D-alanine ligase
MKDERDRSRRPLTKACIGVLMGGTSAEREVSLRSGRAVWQALIRRGYRAVTIDARADVPRMLRARRVAMVFLALHGRGGEDGTMQGLLEVMGIPYTGSGVRASAIAMHKPVAKTVLAAHGIPVPGGVVVEAGQARAAPPAGLKPPLVVKPASEGSTIGVTILRRASGWRAALRRAHAHDREALVEPYISGRELTVSVLDGRALTPIEIVAQGGFYDYTAKYTKGRTTYLCPAPLSPAATRRLGALAVEAYRSLGCDGAARVDFRLTPRGQPFVLEVNTIPGMTETSLLPMAAAQAGLDYDVLTERILQSALRRAGSLTKARTPRGGTR